MKKHGYPQVCLTLCIWCSAYETSGINKLKWATELRCKNKFKGNSFHINCKVRKRETKAKKGLILRPRSMSLAKSVEGEGVWRRHISFIHISLNPYSQTQIKRPTHFLLATAKISNPFAHIANCSKFTFPCEATEQAQYVCLDYITPGFL